MRIILLPALAALLAGCVSPPPPPAFVDASIDHEMAKASGRKTPPVPQLEESLLPPLRMEMPQAGGAPIDARFDLSVSNASAAQVFNSLVSGTRYSMLVHPSVAGSISVNLKDVTLREALDSIRDLYGYEYKMDGTRILIQPAGIQTRVFQVNYLSGQRRGLSQLRVTSNSQAELLASGTSTASGASGIGGVSGVGGVGGVGTAAGTGFGATGTQAGAATNRESTRVTTTQEATFWSDLCEALVALTFPDAAAAPTAGGGQQQPEDRQRAICNRRHGASDRSIVASPHSGVVVVRGTAAELRAVENYLRASRLAVERQVMLEAKIIEVTLSNQYQSGINWAVFNSRVTAGQISRSLNPGIPALQTGTAPSFTPGSQLAGQAVLLGQTGTAGAVFGLAVASSNFDALITFLETQGNVQVLSSPRVATLNNQKAVLKVGDELLAISQVSVTPGTPAAVGVAGTQPTVTPQFSPYFSGIVLDVTPQIDDGGNITLHVHPSINSLSPNNVTVTLVQGTAPVDVPTVRSTVRETDTIVRVTDGNIVAIGGLMRTEVSDVRGGIPGISDGGILGFLFRNTTRVVEKKELVILLKPTIIDSDREWAQDVRETRERLDGLGRQMREGRR
jgi:MSHA biogenesis protein MshL